MFAKIVMCVCLGTLLGLFAAAVESVAVDPLGPSDISDGAGVVVSVSAAWSPALLHPGR